jgi:flagellar protein FlaG
MEGGVNMNVRAVDTSGAMAGSPSASASPKQDLYLKEKAADDADAGREQVKRMLSDMQVQIDRMNVSLQFYTYGERGDKVVVVVADKETGEVIREIPSKEIQNLHAKMSELAGMIFDRQA